MKTLSSLLLLVLLTCVQLCFGGVSQYYKVSKVLCCSGSRDTILLYNEHNDTFSTTPNELGRILVKFPLLKFKKKALPPDTVFAHQMANLPADYAPGYDCELCKDFYYILYGYLLKKYDGERRHVTQRSRLINIFRKINGIHEGLAYGGTYFGHQHLRIIGYAEYAVYQYSNHNSGNTGFYKKKKAYLKWLNMQIDTSLDKNEEISIKTRKFIKTELHKTTTKLNSLITNSFYLYQVMHFQKECYTFENN